MTVYINGVSAYFVPYNGKIADLQENDITKHFEDISAFVPANCVAVILASSRAAGTGNILYFPNESTKDTTSFAIYGSHSVIVALASGTQRFQWRNTVANDDWDIYMFGYFVRA